MKNGLELYIDENEKNHVAVVINFDGPGGMVIVGNDILVTGENRSESSERLYITTRAVIIAADGDDGKPDIRFVHQK